MNVTKENTGELNAIVKVELAPADYLPQVDKILKEQQKKANMPGFRPGHVPIGVVKKMYGKAVLAEEIQKMVSEKLFQYIKENEINILAHPMINREKTKIEDFREDMNYEFYYDLGLSPSIEVDLDKIPKVTYYDIQANDAVVEKYLYDIRRRYGKFSAPETAGENDLVYGEFEELDASGNVVEGGIKNTASVSLEFLKNAEGKKMLTGAKKDDVITLDMSQVSHGATETAAMLRIDKEKAENLTSKFRFTIKNVSHIEPAELNSELFEKIYRNKNITSEEELRAEIIKDSQISFDKESDRYFMETMVDVLLEAYPLSLPDEFLKRFIIENNEKVTPEDVEKEYPLYVKNMKWQLIDNQIIKKYNLEASEKDMHEYVENYVRTQVSAMYAEAFTDERIHQFTHHLLQSKEEMEKITEKYYDEKLLEFFKTSLKIERKSVTYEEFIKLAIEKK